MYFAKEISDEIHQMEGHLKMAKNWKRFLKIFRFWNFSLGQAAHEN
jgi:hypothetical protein